ncbi:DUF222 domain-containing protein [Gordonia polyisoprenivorans]|uniref:HNH endonuclease n=1 Tax=Gordonia polyisoprenivorans TaxID=84595 RepID=UPI0030CBEEE2
MLETTDDLREFACALVEMTPATTQSDAVERITFLEELKSAAAAAQVRETARLDELRAADETERNVPQGKRGKGLSAEVGLARKASAQRGGQFLGFARALATEMPHTLGALEDGDLTEWRATILVRETAYLTRESREEIDRVVAGDRQALLSMGDRALTARAKELAYELEPRTVVDRKAKAERDRRVSVRPAPDLMAQVSALLPMAQGIAVFAALKRHADTLVGSDGRTRDQIMADTLVERVTGQASATAVPVAVNLVLSAETMLGGDASAEIPGFGPIPAEMARQLIADGVDPDGETASTIRRLYVRPAEGTLVAADARSRCFPSSLAHFVRMRDRRCRVPFCDAPIAEIDHARPHRHGGPTSLANADGTCVAHNRAKEADGWTYTPIDTEYGHILDVTTPTGAWHRSRAPHLVGRQPRASMTSTWRKPKHPHRIRPARRPRRSRQPNHVHQVAGRQ